MNTQHIRSAAEVPFYLQKAAKVAFAVGALSVRVNESRDALLVQFADSDTYYFDPETVTLHMLEALGHARTHGMMHYEPPIDHAPVPFTPVRMPLVIRTTFSTEDVRVQIGASRWYRVIHPNTAHAFRHAIVDAFCAYYDEAISPYQA